MNTNTINKVNLLTKYIKGILMISLVSIAQYSSGQNSINESTLKKIDKEVEELMEEGMIPGLSLVIVKNGQSEIRNYGYSNVEKKTPVNASTLFEIGSCSKAFTALGVAKLVDEGKIDLNKNVSDYIPWFKVHYEGKKVPVKVKNLLHHTSGIPWKSISEIPESNAKDALEKTVKSIQGYDLGSYPGTKYEYATINYDVLALIIQKVTGETFESFLQREVIDALSMTRTTIGNPIDPKQMSLGYKINYLAARPYDAPVFKGNNAAGYVISNSTDMAGWLKFQMGLGRSELYPLAQFTHKRDESVSIHGESSYAAGWEVALNGTGEVYHAGLNPNFSSFVSFRKKEGIGVAILTNSNSSYTNFIGFHIQKMLAEEEIIRELNPNNGVDSTFTLIVCVIGFYLLIVVAYFIRMIVQIAKGKRKLVKVRRKDLTAFFTIILAVAPFVFGIYILPTALSDFTWETIAVWMPNSFTLAAQGLFIAMVTTLVVYGFGLFYPEVNKYKQMAPSILLVSILTGLSGVMVIMIVTSSFSSDMDLKYMVFYYGLILMIYLLGRRFVQKRLIEFTNGLMYDMRLQIVSKIFSTSYHKFEKIDKERVYTTLNDDVTSIGNSTGMFVTLVTSIITVVGAFLYLASIALWATFITISVLLMLTVLGFYIIKKTRHYFEQARDAQNDFVRLINGLIQGYKELSLHRKKKLEYKQDMAVSAGEYKTKLSIADMKAFDGSLVGESMLVLLLGFAAFGMPEVFPNISLYIIMSFVMVLLYLIGPVNGILQSAPQFAHVMVSWNRIKTFTAEIPTNIELSDVEPTESKPELKSISISNVAFNYNNSGVRSSFGIGPISMKANSGDIIFIIGGNGCGKTTLAKLLTGLYIPDSGVIKINGKQVENYELGEYYSSVFSPSYLFEKLYNVETKGKEELVDSYLKLFDLQDKVSIKDNRFDTIDLSSGQRKRLALLQCYLEDSSIYLFDEWAADQDPEYRKFFYRTLLPEMKRKGKIVIAITHDDHYFDVADRVLKMSDGKLEEYTDSISIVESH